MTVTIITDTTASARIYVIHATYSTARLSASGTLDQANLVIGQETGYYVLRLYLVFDTSAIPAGAVISAAKVQLWCTADMSTDDFDFVVQNGQPTYPHNPVVAGDYDLSNYLGDGGSFGSAGLVAIAYNDITLNATGRGWINKGGTTKLCIRSSKDISDTAPANSEWAMMGSALRAGNEPKLEITWTGPPPRSGAGVVRYGLFG